MVSTVAIAEEFLFPPPHHMPPLLDLSVSVVLILIGQNGACALRSSGPIRGCELAQLCEE